MTIEHVRAHFEDEAKKFDGTVQRLIPNYDAMIAALVSVIPFPREKAFYMVDLGCGTGTLSKAVKDSFPNAAVTCIDIASKMLEIAKDKLGRDVNYIQADFKNFSFSQKYDLIISSLALHHLETDDDKFGVYQKIYAALNNGGMFINIDFVLGSDEELQEQYMKKWKEFLAKSMSQEEITKKWIPNYYAEDRPTALTTHLEMLDSCGFSSVDVIYKYFNFAVYCGRKKD